MLSRIASGIATFLLAMVPMLICHTALVTHWSQKEANEPALGVKTPNPAQAPTVLLSPTELLVSTDPWFAGTMIFWLWPGVFALSGLAIAAAVAVKPAAVEPMSKWRRPRSWLGIALLSGCVFAMPWFYAVWSVFA